MKTTSMNPDKKPSAPNPGAKIKKLVLPMDTSKSNLAQEIKRMFDMAKSAGQELDLTFSQRQAGTF